MPSSIIDEAYVHFSGPGKYVDRLVKAGKDVVVLRTFSKIYGMAGLRAGAAYGRPDLLAKVRQYRRQRLHAGDGDGLRGGQHEGGSEPDEGTAGDQQEESRTGFRIPGEERASGTSPPARTSS